MGNASLKEQLQALAIEVPKKKIAKVPKKNNPVQAKAPKPKPAWLEYVQYGVELLKVHYPNCFKDFKNIQPLKVGIKHDLTKALSSREDIVIPDKACMINSLSYYVNSTAYHKSVVKGAVRVDLEGANAGEVSLEEANYSADRFQAKLNKKKAKQVAKEKTPPMPSVEKIET